MDEETCALGKHTHIIPATVFLSGVQNYYVISLALIPVLLSNHSTGHLGIDLYYFAYTIRHINKMQYILLLPSELLIIATKGWN